MVRFAVIALVAFLLPGVVYYLWRAFAPARLGGSAELAQGGWYTMPWRRLAYAGLVAVAVALAVFVSIEREHAPSSELWQGVSAPPGR